jgi:hypothetical protein
MLRLAPCDDIFVELCTRQLGAPADADDAYGRAVRDRGARAAVPWEIA